MCCEAFCPENYSGVVRTTYPQQSLSEEGLCWGPFSSPMSFRLFPLYPAGFNLLPCRQLSVEPEQVRHDLLLIAAEVHAVGSLHGTVICRFAVPELADCQYQEGLLLTRISILVSIEEGFPFIPITEWINAILRCVLFRNLFPLFNCLFKLFKSVRFRAVEPISWVV